MKTFAFAASSKGAPLAPFTFDSRELRANDVRIDIRYSGICHTDIHMVRDDWGWTQFPVVPGHEIVGRVAAVGSAVTKYKVGDDVAVGTLVDSCRECDQCKKGQEVYCRKGVTQTFNDKDRIDGKPTYGGYAKQITVREEFVLRLPKGLDPSRAAPLLCAGITCYSPLKTWGAGPGKRVAVVGIGGLGHLGVKFAVALGAEVTVITRSPDKAREAKALGAHHTLLSTDKDAMAAKASSFDLIIDTIPVDHEIEPYLNLVDVDGTLVIVGAITMQTKVNALTYVMGRRRVSGSGTGGLPETQEMLELAAAKNVHPETELIRMEQIAEAYERVERGDVRYRFVIDMEALEPSPASAADKATA